MMKDLVIFGAGGFAREVSLLVEEINQSGRGKDKWNLLGFIDEDQDKWGLVMRGYPVLGGFDALAGMPENVMVIGAVGDPFAKQRLVEKVVLQGHKFATLIYPGIQVNGDLSVGEGVIISKESVLTTNIELGDHVSINPGCGIGHDATIGAFSTLMWRVNVSGAAVIEERCMLGTGSVVLPGKRVGRGSVIGAGAVVTKDLPAGCTAVGVPARVTREFGKN